MAAVKYRYKCMLMMINLKNGPAFRRLWHSFATTPARLLNAFSNRYHDVLPVVISLLSEMR